ncbi:heavy-metal-associated domain-containing protein, partial [Escherichia coli]|uniref:heavy-metal-associated domain-containing protein n=1 Tax=Escherichia coli TaxID=562 RepID=UPI002158373E
MKALSITAILFLSLFTTLTAAAQATTKESIKVWGNCGMCKKNIEKAAKKGGATTANWNEDSKQLTVSYKAAKTTGIKIQQAIA